MPPAALLGGAVAAPIVGSLIGQAAASGNQDAATAAQQAALQQILNVQAPTIAQQQWNLAQEKSAGNLTPASLGTINQGPSAYGGISVDPRLRQAQFQALASLQQQANGGLNAQDLANLYQINNQASGNANAAQGAILQNMAARGMGGGGAELAARLMAAQNAANMGASQGLGIAAQAQNRALQALQGSGQLGQSMEGQQYGEQAQAAEAQNAINRFNAQNAQAVLGQNVQNQNQAQLYNLQNAQNIANTNVGLQNQGQMHNTGLYQQQFQNQLNKAGMASGQYGNMANYQQGLANKTQGMWSGLGQGVGSMAGTGALMSGMGMFGGGAPAGGNPGTTISGGTDLNTFGNAAQNVKNGMAQNYGGVTG